MNAKPERLFWYMVLRTIVLLVLFSTTCTPKIMDSKAIIAGSSTLQHAFGVDQVKRTLGSSREKTENIDGDNEDRSNFLDFFFQLGKADGFFEQLVNNKGEPNDVHFQEWVTAMNIAFRHDHSEAETAKILKLESYLNNAERNTYVNILLEQVLIDMLMAGEQYEKVLTLLSANKDFHEFLKSPLLSIWIEKYGDAFPYSLLLDFLLRKQGQVAVVAQLIEAKSAEASREIATKLEKVQLKRWLETPYSEDVVFELLGLDIVGNNMVNSRVWSTWVLYMSMLEEIKYPVLQRNVAALVRSKLKNDGLVNKWIATGETFEGTKEAAELLKLEPPAT